MAINRAGMTWTPPNNVEPVQLMILVSKPALLVGTWAGLVLLATLSALRPANRAARLVIVDALRHV
jgi:putative ABC transport system permease protein